MYPPPHHQSDDIQKMISLIQHYPLGMLVSANGNCPFITHIPIIYNETSGRLVAHIDRQNPQMGTLQDGAEVTVVFKGPDTYISPSIYSTAQLPTWNYLIVHITGRIRLIQEPSAVKNTMMEMTRFLEGPEQRFELKHDDPRMERLLSYIQTFDIEITNWEGKFKLSQDKNPTDFELAKQALIDHSKLEDESFIQSMYEIRSNL
jgi:transcriptional regulator